MRARSLLPEVPGRDGVMGRLAGCESLPTLPAAAMAVLEISAQASVDVSALAAVIGKDPALSLRILRVVNSPCYGLPQRVKSIPQAIALLGLHNVRSLVLGFSLVQAFGGRGVGFDHLHYWRRSMYAAAASRVVAERAHPGHAEECFVAALLMDFGMLVLSEVLGSAYGEVCQRCAVHADLLAAEAQALGVTHAEAGAFLAERWRLPEVFRRCVAHHHDPDAVEDAGHRKVARVIALGGRCADVFTAASAAGQILAVRRLFKEWYQIGELEADGLLTLVGQRTAELAPLFDVQLNAGADYASILGAASERLLELSLAESDSKRGERRRAQRIRREGHILLIPCAAGRLLPAVRARLNDLSATGIGVTHEAALELGSQFVVRLGQSDGTCTSLLYSVVRCAPEGRQWLIGAELASVLRPQTAEHAPTAGAGQAITTAARRALLG